MLKNNLKIAWRQLKKNRLVSTINIVGLGLGLTVGIFILLYIQHETSYDTWIPDQENIYRVYRPYANGTKGNLTTPVPVARALQEEIPGVVSASRYINWGDKIIEWKNVRYSVQNVAGVDSTFFQSIPLPFKYGDPKFTDRKKNLVVLSHTMAQRIFEKMNPVGENILLENTDLLEVVGVLAPPLAATHLDREMYVITERDEGFWTGGFGNTYVRLSPSTKIESVTATLFDIAKREIIKEDLAEGETTDESTLPQWELQPMAEIHMNSQHLGQRGASSGSPWQIRIMVLIGGLVLLIAAINYINLTTAQMSTRAKEVGIRNVIGGTRKQLVGQFLSEAVLTTFLALMFAVLLSGFLLPFFNEMISREIPFHALFLGWTPPLIIGMTLVLGLATGIFPAFYLSKINPVDSLKSKFFRDNGSSVYRNSLIISQFVLSIGCVLFVTMVWQQVHYMMEKDLGFSKNKIAVFRINGDDLLDNFYSKKSQFLSIPGVESVAQVSRTPGGRISNYGIHIEGKDIKPYVNILFGDPDWNKTFQVPLKAGRFLSNDIPTDTSSAFVVNETFVEKFGIENPIGQRIKFSYDEHYSTIVGVVEDFHYNGLQSKILPVAICAKKDKAWMGNVAFRFESDKLSSSLAAVTKAWQKLEPDFPITYSFLDDEFNKQYKTYIDFGRNMTYATVICFFLALIGLFGLTVFIIQRRTKEIGIRKVLGASATSIVGLLSKDFLKLVVIAFLIAAPLAWYFVNGWLENFAYRLEIQWWVFLLVGALAVGIAFLTVGFQSLKAALTNPVDSIGTE